MMIIQETSCYIIYEFLSYLLSPSHVAVFLLQLVCLLKFSKFFRFAPFPVTVKNFTSNWQHFQEMLITVSLQNYLNLNPKIRKTK